MRPEFRADPYPGYAFLRSTDPVFSPFPGIHVLSRYANVAAVLRDERMSSDFRKSVGFEAFVQSMGGSLTQEEFTPSMLFLDPPDHSRLRALVNKAFTAREVEKLRPRVGAIVDELLEARADPGSMDVIADLAYPLPVTVICEFLGVPPRDQGRFRAWSADLVHTLDPVVPPETVRRAEEASLAFRAYFRDLIGERRQTPRDDLLSRLIAAEEEGDKLSEEELLSTCVLLLVAGHETTVNLIGNGVLALLRNPGELARLREDPALIRSAVEELLRYDSPIQLNSRTALEDLQVDGRLVKKGEQTINLLGAANRDPEQFTEPDRLDLGRQDNRHLSFSAGMHFCLGAPLARLEGQLAIGGLVARFPALDLATEDLRWRETVTFRGLQALPVNL
jgi:pimeloyl-[acyl-carrier protein] synthase